MDSSLQKDQDGLEREKNEKRILVVDDESLIRNNIKFMLEDTELYSVQTAPDGDRAINLFKQQAFDLLITDYNMPKMNGYELFKRCKAISSKLPVVFITGTKFNEEVIEKIKLQGHVEFVFKPFDANILFKIVDILIRASIT